MRSFRDLQYAPNPALAFERSASGTQQVKCLLRLSVGNELPHLGADRGTKARYLAQQVRKNCFTHGSASSGVAYCVSRFRHQSRNLRRTSCPSKGLCVASRWSRMRTTR